jgi:hypothetical protein
MTQTAHNYLKSMLLNPWSPTKAPSSSGTCVDTEGWKDENGNGCEFYQGSDYPGCPLFGNDDLFLGTMGPASENCCYCKDPTVSQIILLHAMIMSLVLVKC